MSSQLSILDLVFSGSPDPVGPPLSAKDLRDSGMESVLSHTVEDFKERFKAVVEILPRGTRFTVETVRNALAEVPLEINNNYFGAQMAGLAKKKMIRFTGRMVNAERKSRHAGLLRQWERL